MMPNPLLQRVPRAKLPPHMQKVWDFATEVTGDATFIEVSGSNPPMFDWYMDDFYQKVFYSGRIDKQVVELVRLRLANIHGCAFCNKGDTAAALAAGISQDQVDALPDYENGPFSADQKAALALADIMVLTNPKGQLSEETYARARKHFSDAQILELGMIMAVLSGMAKMLFAFDCVEKEDYCPFA